MARIEISTLAWSNDHWLYLLPFSAHPFPNHPSAGEKRENTDITIHEPIRVRFPSHYLESSFLKQ